MSNATIGATQPSSSTVQPSQRQKATHVQWVFPRSLISPIADGHALGRDSSCEVVLEGNEASRRHALFRVEGLLVYIEDLGSSNGLFVNGQRTARAPLAVNDVIRCGEWVGIVEFARQLAEFSELAPGWYGGQRLRAAVEPAKRANPKLPIVVQGETGTGKEGVAQAIHRWSERRGPFVPINCATLPEHLAESELFGHKKGAFSGAERPSQGLFRAADGGTLFLDEVLELPRQLQAKLLRAIEQQEVLPLGETKPVPIDIRLVAASQEPLAQAVSDSRFRADLHARLDGLTIVLPPLRERRTDIVPLIMHFMRRGMPGHVPALDAKFVEALCVYDWPLNVRELSLLIQQLVDLHGHEPLLRKSHLPDRVVSRLRPSIPAQATAPSEPAKRAWASAKDEPQFDALVAALREHNGSVAKAAAALGINRGRAYRLLQARPDFSLDNAKGKT